MVANLVYLLIVALILVSMWKIFEKAGRPGWEGIIPFYNFYIILKLVGKPAWWLILLFVPIVNIVIAILTYIPLAKDFGKSEGFGVGLALLGFIFFPILAFGDAKYIGKGLPPTLPAVPPSVPQT